MASLEEDPRRYVRNIADSGLSIYDPIQVGNPDLWIPSSELEFLLNEGLKDFSLRGLELRTRSKVIKEQVCKALGYPVPKSFRKTQPRFPGQCFDTYGQKALNFQVWNEQVSSTRRYVMVGIDGSHNVSRVKVVNGDTLAVLDTTGKLTQKYQARCTPGHNAAELISRSDTSVILPALSSDDYGLSIKSPISQPRAGEILPISTVFDRLKGLVSQRFASLGHWQERNRGAELHKLVCQALGYADYGDDGQFPDIRHQLLEVKLQTSQTIDLGLVRPDSKDLLDAPQVRNAQIRHCDVRYAVFYAQIVGIEVSIMHLFVTTGEDFFGRFPQFQGKVLNKKLQIHLPSDFFSP